MTPAEEFATALKSRLPQDTSIRAHATRAQISTPTMHQVLTGRRLPSRDLLERILNGSPMDAADHTSLMRLWSRLMEEKEGRPAGRLGGVGRSRIVSRSAESVPQFGQPDPLRVSTPAQLIEALRAVHIWAGAPSLRTLEARSDGRLRRSSVSDMLRGEELPDYDRYIAFLRTCGIQGPNLDVWVFTWRRLRALERPEAAWMPGIWGAKGSVVQ